MVNLSTRVLFGLIFLPAVLLSLALSSTFSASCMKQLEYSSRVKILYVPLAIASLDNWFVFILLLTALLGIIWPKGGPHPVLTFGASFLIIFPATFSIFVGAEIHFSSMRYRDMLNTTEIAIKTKYQRILTQDMLNSLTYFQEKSECCGLIDHKYYCPKNESLPATPDDEHDTNMKKVIHLNRVVYLAGNYSNNRTSIELANANFTLEPGKLPDSCCKNGKCISNCSSKVVGSDVHKKGCAKDIIKPLDPCLRVIPISYVFPWIAFFYAAIFSWAHLRKSQGVDVMEFGSIKKVKSVKSLPLADPEDFEKKDMPGVTKLEESLAGESKNLTPKENVSKSPSKNLTPATVPKVPSSKVLTLPAGRRNSKLSAKVPSYSKVK